MADRAVTKRPGAGGHQKDTGWSWIVMIAHFFTLLIMVGIQKSTGIFFVEILQKFDVTASMASLVTGTASASASITVIFVMTCVVNVISERQCVMIGTTIMVASMAICSFSTSFPVFVLFLGALQGIGASFIYGPSFVMLGKYFSRHLTSAQAFATTGVSLGGAIVPLIIRATIDEFTFPAGMLIVAGLQANIFVTALLLRPVPQSALVDTPTSASDAESGEELQCGDVRTQDIRDRNGKAILVMDGLRNSKESFKCKDAHHEGLVIYGDELQGLKAKPQRDGNGNAFRSGKVERAPSGTERQRDRDGSAPRSQSPEHKLSGWLLSQQKGAALPDYSKDIYSDDAASANMYDVSDIEAAISDEEGKREAKRRDAPGGPRDDDASGADAAPHRGSQRLTAETRDFIRTRLLARDLRRPRTVSETAHVPLAATTATTLSTAATKPLISSLQSLVPRKRRNPTRHFIDDYDDHHREYHHHHHHRQSLLDKLFSSGIIASLPSVPDAVYISLGGLNRSRGSVHRSTHSGRSELGGGRFVAASAESLTDEHNEVERGEEEEEEATEDAARDRKCGCGDKFDLSVCRMGAFWGMVFVQAFGFLAGALGPAFIPPLAKEKGLTDKEAARLLTVISGLDIMSRLMPGVIAHYKWMKPGTMVFLSLFVMGIMCQMSWLPSSYTGMLAFCIIFGVFSGVFFAMFPAVIIEFTGLERFATAFGFIMLFLGINAAWTHVLLGSLRDWTGTYSTSFHYLGCTAFFASTLLALLSYAKNKKQRADKRVSGGSPLTDVEIEITSSDVETNDVHNRSNNKT